MDDRQSLYPGRVKLKDVDTGIEKTYDMTMADEPVVPGTPPTKENLLTDETEKVIFGDLANRTVNQAFLGLMAKISLIMGNQASVSLSVTDTGGNPVVGVLVDGLFNGEGQQVTTGEDGIVTGYVSEGPVTLGVIGYADIQDANVSFSATKGGSYSKALTVTRRNYIELLSSKKTKFSPDVESVDVTVLAAGGGGAFSTQNQYFNFGGGAGGECTVKTGVDFIPNTEYSAVVGAGGAAGSEEGTDGSPGGNSSFLGVESNGGGGGKQSNSYGGTGDPLGGIGNGNGGYGYRTEFHGDGNLEQPTEGTVDGYSSYTETVRYGGGGQGGYLYPSSSGPVHTLTNSTTNGGKYVYGDQDSMNGKDGFGSGGAGSCRGNNNPGRGGNGKIAVRMHLKYAV